MNMIVTLVVYRHLLLIMMPTTIIILTSPKEPLGANELGKSAPWQLGQHVPVEERPQDVALQQVVALISSETGD